MKLDDIVTSIATENDLKKGQVKKIVTKLFDTIKTSVEAGEKVSVPGMGSFMLTERAAGTKTGKDGAERAVAQARFVSFKPSRVATGKVKKAKAGAAG